MSRCIYSHSTKQYLCPLTPQFRPNHLLLCFEPDNPHLNYKRNCKKITSKKFQLILFKMQLLSFNKMIPFSLDTSTFSRSSLALLSIWYSLSKLNKKPQKHHFKEPSADTCQYAFALIQQSNTFVLLHLRFLLIILLCFVLSLILLV